MSCRDCGAYVDPINFIEEWAARLRELRGRQAVAERPVMVNELCTGARNTAARRDALRDYLQRLEGWKLNVVE